MHRYFLARAEKFENKDGRMEMLKELAHLDNHFELASVVTRAMRSAMSQKVKKDGSEIVEKITFDFSQVKKPGREFPGSWLNLD
jgi:hypothetical protein